MRYMSLQVFLELSFSVPLIANATVVIEDTFLLLDGLEVEAEALKELRATVCLEIG